MDLQLVQKDVISAALSAGEILKSFYRKKFSIKDKEILGDLVTEADIACEKELLSLLLRKYPQIPILSEESGQVNIQPNHEYLWVIDPLDGTINFAHGFPFFAISIGLLYKGNSVLGLVYNPVLNELFTAIKGEGCLQNGEPIKVSSIQTLQQSLLSTGFPYDRRERLDNNYMEFSHLTHLTHGVRRLGAASLDLAFVASGSLDGYWERGLKPWDMAAGILLVQEAKGKISLLSGNPFHLFQDQVIATNGNIHEDLIEALRRSSKMKQIQFQL